MALIGRLRAFLAAKIGRCSLCMRWSLKGALWGWLTYGLILWTVGSKWGYAAIVWPLSFSVLWLLHITVFGFRSARSRVSGGEAANRSRAAGLSRRQLIAFTSGAFTAVLLSIGRPLTANAIPCPPGRTLSACGADCLPPGTTCCAGLPCPPGHVCVACAGGFQCVPAGSHCINGTIRIPRGAAKRTRPSASQTMRPTRDGQ